MAHPDLFAVVIAGKPALKQRDVIDGGGDIGAAELGSAAAARNLAAFDTPAQFLHHHLLAIADAQDRHTQGEHRRRRARAALAHNAVGAAGKDHGARRETGKKRVVDILIGVDFAIDVQLAQAAGNQLGDLAAEVDDKKAVMGCLAHTLPIFAQPCACKWAIAGRGVFVAYPSSRSASPPG